MAAAHVPALLAAACLALLVASVGAASSGGSGADLLKDGLLGQPFAANFSQYAGYVPIAKSRGKMFYYVFVEAESEPAKKPLVLWLNGGPGCSSVGNGFFAENGPWRVKDGKGDKLIANPSSWNKVANMLYLESPAGVGFSYSNFSSDYVANDSSTALDNYYFLVGWLNKFPQYKNRTFYISGESYAGHYIPQLASTIIQRNKNPSKYSVKANIPLGGVIIGNSYMDDDIDGAASDRAVGIFFDGYTLDNIYALAYNVFATKCAFNGFDIGLEVRYHDLFRNKLLAKRLQGPLKKSVNEKPPSTVPIPFDISNPECYDYWIYLYLNRPEVQKSINANVTGQIPYRWYTCSTYTGLDYTREVSSTLSVVKSLIKSKIRVWLYGGDVDAVVPFYGTQQNARTLGLTLKADYTNWYYFDQPAGVVAQYAGLTVLSMRASGHFVPYDKPEAALHLFTRFLAGKPLSVEPFSKA